MTLRTACRCLSLTALSLIAVAALAQAPRWVAQWPLDLPSTDAGAYEVELDADVYATTASPALRDLVIVNAEGRQVPVLLQSAATPAPRRETQSLAWFALPAADTFEGRDIAAISELDPDGRLRRIQWQPRADTAPAALLVDASAATAPLQALVLDWGIAQAPFERSLRIETSNDLRRWRRIDADARLLDLQRDGDRLVERRIGFSAPIEARYLRLTPGEGAGTMPPLVSVIGESTVAAAAADLQWHTLDAVEDAEGAYRFLLDARVPVSEVDIGLAGNATARWNLSVRESDDAPWRTITSDWLVYRVGADASSSLKLDGPLRARQWRLLPDTAIASGAPTLRLGWRPERLVFVAEGAPPYALRAGSALGTRIDAPVAPLLADLRSRNGGNWQPASATLGARAPLDGDGALRHTPPRDWRTWMLWGVLLLGVALVGGFAISLLRNPRAR